jgi:hypothetical protein
MNPERPKSTSFGIMSFIIVLNLVLGGISFLFVGDHPAYAQNGKGDTPASDKESGSTFIRTRFHKRAGLYHC